MFDEKTNDSKIIKAEKIRDVFDEMKEFKKQLEDKSEKNELVCQEKMSNNEKTNSK